MDSVVCWKAETGQALGWHFSIRHRVFVEEQRLISLTDVDEHDRDPTTVHALACRDATAAGTVRLYPAGPEGRWKGDRLAVLPNHRATLVGMRLVVYAVSYAWAHGGSQMDALVQTQNVRFFERIGWTSDGPEVSYFGTAHQPMSFQLNRASELEATQVPDDVNLRLPAIHEARSPLLSHS